MLAVVIAAAFVPNTGIVQAQSSTDYSHPSSSTVSPWVYLGIAAAVIVAGLLVALLLLSRRRRPPPSKAAPVQPWQGGPPAGAGGAAPAAPPAAPPTPPGAAPAYLETPEDVGHAPPAVPVSKAGVAAGAGAGAAAGTAAAAGGEAEPDIDSLMAELDKISSEILKRAPKKGAQQPPTEPPGGANQ